MKFVYPLAVMMVIYKVRISCGRLWRKELVNVQRWFGWRWMKVKSGSWWI